MASSIHVYQLVLFVLISLASHAGSSVLPLVINTWPFTNATQKAWEVLASGTGSPLDAVVAGCRQCQDEQCDGTVGFGGSPDEAGETTLDAMIMNGNTYEVGSVGYLRRVKDAIGVARAVMEHTHHTLIVGEAATKFASEMGFKEESLATNSSTKMWQTWRENKCQPNFRKNVKPDSKLSCGPYEPSAGVGQRQQASESIGPNNHDTIGMVVVGKDSSVMAGTSTNGANHKVPGRVGDSPIVGAGAYASSQVGGAAATGDGDVMMRFLPSFHAVTLLGQGVPVSKAAEMALAPIAKAYPTFTGALVVADAKGNFGAACHGLKGGFHYSVANAQLQRVKVYIVKCI